MERITAMTLVNKRGWTIDGAENKNGAIALTIIPPQDEAGKAPIDEIVRCLGCLLENPSETPRMTIELGKQTSRAIKDATLLHQLDTPLETLIMTVRLQNVLVFNGLHPNHLPLSFAGQLAQRTDDDLKRSKGLGRKMQQEIEHLLDSLGLKLGMNEELARLGWTPETAIARNDAMARTAK